MQHREIAKAFGLNHVGSALHSINQIKHEMSEGKRAKETRLLEKMIPSVK